MRYATDKSETSTNTSVPNIIRKNNSVSISNIFLSFSVSLGALFALAISFICYIKWKRKTRIRKYKKALHLQSQDEEYHRILTLQHHNMKTHTQYFPPTNIVNAIDTFPIVSENTFNDNKAIVPEAYNYLPYNDICPEKRSNNDVHSIYTDPSKYLSLDRSIRTDLSHLDIKGPLGNSQMIRVNLINFTASPKKCTDHNETKTLRNGKRFQYTENLVSNSNGRIDLALVFTSISNSCDPYNSGEYLSSITDVVNIRRLKQECPKQIRKIFRRELDNLNQISHKNLITFSVVQEEDQLGSFVVGEYTPLTDIHSILQSLSGIHRNNNLISIEQSQLLYVSCQISEGMNYLECMGLVHRDLSCRNVLVMDNTLFIKISDLAIAQSHFRSQYWDLGDDIFSESNELELYKSRQLIPIRWIPWETIVKKEFSSKSDVYSFGICMWELFTYCQQVPYQRLTDYQIFMNKCVLSSNMQPLESLFFPQSTARELIDIVEQCLVDDAKQRPTFKEIYLFFMNKNCGYRANEVLVNSSLLNDRCSRVSWVSSRYSD